MHAGDDDRGAPAAGKPGPRGRLGGAGHVAAGMLARAPGGPAACRCVGVSAAGRVVAPCPPGRPKAAGRDTIGGALELYCGLIVLRVTTWSMSLFLNELQVPPVAAVLSVMIMLPRRTALPAAQLTPVALWVDVLSSRFRTAPETPAEKPAKTLCAATLSVTKALPPAVLIFNPAVLWSRRTRSRTAEAVDDGAILMPWPLFGRVPQLRTMVLETCSWLPATVGVKVIPLVVKLLMVEFSTVTSPPVLTRTPLKPVP